MFHSLFFIFTFYLLLNVIYNKEIKELINSRTKNSQSQALEQWALSLTNDDYNYDKWRIKFHSRSTVDFFNGYAKLLSKVFKKYNAKVNFVMIGACDGTGDNTIKHLYLPNDHWRGVFVEPLTMNIRDLIRYMSINNATYRSYIIQAAATAKCKSSTLFMERPLYEEKNDSSIPHWLRRQIGSLLPSSTSPKGRNNPRKGWTTEEVRCMTVSDVISEWSSLSKSTLNQSNAQVSYESSHQKIIEDILAIKLNNTSQNKYKRNKKIKKRRPHVLKIDVEGHDFDVLMGFLNINTPIEELPLLIDFEAKSVAKQFPLLVKRMEDLGYTVSPFGQDGFAILHGHRILQSLEIKYLMKIQRKQMKIDMKNKE